MLNYMTCTLIIITLMALRRKHHNKCKYISMMQPRLFRTQPLFEVLEPYLTVMFLPHSINLFCLYLSYSLYYSILKCLIDLSLSNTVTHTRPLLMYVFNNVTL